MGCVSSNPNKTLTSPPIQYPTCECTARDFDPSTPAFHPSKRFRLRTLIALPIYSSQFSLPPIHQFPLNSTSPRLRIRN
ncbi:hypothetical protein L1887_36169 [Cichorium endivia]|nr:hypothetical protein L1887_36169 [Cichorium endivia]